jgi:hypothetical protein
MKKTKKKLSSVSGVKNKKTNDQDETKSKFSFNKKTKKKHRSKPIDEDLVKRIVVKFTKNDIRKIRSLLLMGIELRFVLKSKNPNTYKMWIRMWPHIYVKSRTILSVYRKMFLRLKRYGVIFQ